MLGDDDDYTWVIMSFRASEMDEWMGGLNGMECK